MNVALMPILFFYRKNMIYLFKCLKMFLTRALFRKHTLLVTAMGSTVFWT